MIDQDHLSNLIGLIYDAAVEPSRWPVAMEGVMDAVGATSGGLHFYDAACHTYAGIVPRTAPEWTRQFRERWVSCCTPCERIMQGALGELFTLETLSPRDELERSAFYNEFLRPQDEKFGCGAKFLTEGAAVGWLVLFRGRRRDQFGCDEARLLATLLPHLQRAAQLQLRLAGLEMQRAGSKAALDHLEQGALLVATDARVMFANRAAEAILAKGKGLRLERGRLTAQYPATTAALRRLIAVADVPAGGGPIAIPCGEDKPPLAAFVVRLPQPTELPWLTLPERPCAIVFVKDAERAPLPGRQLANLFGLTPAQERLAMEIARGEGGLPVAADRLGIAYATARAHLAVVFEKTGVHTQAELVRLLLDCDPGVRTD
jgi:DNA-binding CsgD family transcriptional regulator